MHKSVEVSRVKKKDQRNFMLLHSFCWIMFDVHVLWWKENKRFHFTAFFAQWHPKNASGYLYHISFLTFAARAAWGLLSIFVLVMAKNERSNCCWRGLQKNEIYRFGLVIRGRRFCRPWLFHNSILANPCLITVTKNKLATRAQHWTYFTSIL